MQLFLFTSGPEIRGHFVTLIVSRRARGHFVTLY